MKKQFTEQQLKVLLTSGKPSDFEIIYTRYADALYGVLLKIIPDEDEAADLLQEAFLKIWNNASKYDGSKGTIFTWMLNVSRNLAIDKLRSKDFKHSKQNQTLEVSVNNIERNLNGDMDLNPMAFNELREFVSKLPEQLSILISMVYLDGYTQAEVAEQLNIPLGTVKTRIRTALQLLRKQY